MQALRRTGRRLKGARRVRRLGSLLVLAALVAALILALVVIYVSYAWSSGGKKRNFFPNSLRAFEELSFPRQPVVEELFTYATSTPVPSAPAGRPSVARKDEESAWLNASTGVLYVRLRPAVGAPVHAQWPIIQVRDMVSSKPRDSKRYRAWERAFAFTEPYSLPSGFDVTPVERNTLMRASIFVSAAGYRDAELSTTVESALERAGVRYRVYFGISEELEAGDRGALDAIGGTLPRGSPERQRRLRAALWGATAPEALEVVERDLTWADVFAGTPIVRTSEARDNQSYIDARRASGRAAPDVVYLNEGYEADRILCVGSRAEEERDLYLLDSVATMSTMSCWAQFPRRGKGGAQQQLRRALAGCRAVVRTGGWQSARGPTYGRYLTSLFYFNQDYYMVVDSHSQFSVHWDYKMIARVMQMRTRGTLSHYPNGYTPAAPAAEHGNTAVMCMCMGQMLDNGMPKLGARHFDIIPGVSRQPFAAAGYIFGDAQFVLDTPFDPFLPHLFDGEETLYSSRMYTAGWDIYCPHEANILHHYGRGAAPRFFSVIKGAAHEQMRYYSVRRALYLLQSAFPWYRTLEARALALLQGKDATKGGPVYTSMGDAMAAARRETPYVGRQHRLIVPAGEAARQLPVVVEEAYYGMSDARGLGDYWDWIGLDDAGVTKRDNEKRLEGSLKACDMIRTFVEEQKKAHREKGEGKKNTG